MKKQGFIYLVHFIDESDPGDQVSICLTPNRQSLSLNSGWPIQYYNSSIKDSDKNILNYFEKGI